MIMIARKSANPLMLKPTKRDVDGAQMSGGDQRRMKPKANCTETRAKQDAANNTGRK